MWLRGEYYESSSQLLTIPLLHGNSMGTYILRSMVSVRGRMAGRGHSHTGQYTDLKTQGMVGQNGTCRKYRFLLLQDECEVNVIWIVDKLIYFKSVKI